MKRQALSWFSAAALVTAIGTADPADARRFDITDAETKAYCEANPTHCKRTINWPATLGLTLGLPAVLGLLGAHFERK
tara:strand:+ start:46 stop:279 length:234 start_codon:yes stop_codon:yes gene_type:complete